MDDNCWNCGCSVCDCKSAPNGRCAKCDTPLVVEVDGKGAEGTGKKTYCCPKCGDSKKPK